MASEQISILLSFLKDDSALLDVKKQLNGFLQTVKAGFTLNIGANIGQEFLSVPTKIKEMVDEGVEYATTVRNMATETRMSAESFQAMSLLAAQSGVEVNLLVQAVQHMSTSTQQAVNGNAAMADTFKRLGINAQDFSKLPVPQQLEALAQAAAKAGWSTSALNDMAEILGRRSAPQLLQALHALADEGFDGLSERAKAAGAVLSDQMTASVAKVGDEWKTTGQIWKVTMSEMVEVLKPLLNALAEISAAIGLMMQGFLKDFEKGWGRIKAMVQTPLDLVGSGGQGWGDQSMWSHYKQKAGASDEAVEAKWSGQAPKTEQTKLDSALGVKIAPVPNAGILPEEQAAQIKKTADEVARLTEQLQKLKLAQAEAADVTPLAKLLDITKQLETAKKAETDYARSHTGKNPADPSDLSSDPAYLKLQVNTGQLQQKANAAQKEQEQAVVAAQVFALETQIKQAELEGNGAKANALQLEVEQLKNSKEDAAATTARVAVLAQEQARKQQIYSLETQIKAAELAGNTTLANSLTIELQRLQTTDQDKTAIEARLAVLKQEQDQRLAIQNIDIAEIPLKEQASELENQLGEIRDNASLTALQKQTTLQATAQEYRVTLSKIIDLENQRVRVTSDPKEVADLKAQIARLQAQLGSAGKRQTEKQVTPEQRSAENYANQDNPEQHFSSAGGGLTAGLQDFVSKMGTLGDQIHEHAEAIASSLTSSIGGALTGLEMRTESWSKAWKSVANGFIQSALNAGNQVLINFAIQTATGVAAHTAGEGAKTAASAAGAASRTTITTVEAAGQITTTTTTVTSHVAGEATKTAASSAGAATRGVIAVGETIVHLIQDGIKLASHIVMEIGKTAITLAQVPIRIATIIAESLANIVNAAAGAMSAMASIPYVGPFLAIGAMAAILAAGTALVKSVGKGFRTGGYTGDGDPNEEAGPVHKGEFVNTQSTVRQFGLPFFQALHRGDGSSALASLSQTVTGDRSPQAEGSGLDEGPAFSGIFPAARQNFLRSLQSFSASAVTGAINARDHLAPLASLNDHVMGGLALRHVGLSSAADNAGAQGRAASSSNPAGGTNAPRQNISLIVTDDRQSAIQAMRSTTGQKMVIDMLHANRGAFFPA